jgi:hypothetical protein
MPRSHFPVPARPSARSRERCSDRVIEHDRSEQQAGIDRVPPAVKEQRRGQQPRRGERTAVSADEEKTEKRGRQKNEQEYEGIEKHLGPKDCRLL